MLRPEVETDAPSLSGRAIASGRAAAKFSMVLVSLLPINGYGIETLSNLALHLK